MRLKRVCKNIFLSTDSAHSYTYNNIGITNLHSREFIIELKGGLKN